MFLTSKEINKIVADVTKENELHDARVKSLAKCDTMVDVAMWSTAALTAATVAWIGVEIFNSLKD